MNKKKNTFTRSDIEASLRKEFPNLSKSEISEAITAILDSITEAVFTAHISHTTIHFTVITIHLE